MTETLPAKLAKLDVPRVYRGTAPLYDVWGRLTESKARDRCLELARIRDGEAVLEVAVGTGLAFAEILKQNPSGRNEGIDLTQEMLDKAIRKAAASGQNNYRLCVGDAYHLYFRLLLAHTFRLGNLRQLLARRELRVQFVRRQLERAGEAVPHE